MHGCDGSARCLTALQDDGREEALEVVDQTRNQQACHRLARQCGQLAQIIFARRQLLLLSACTERDDVGRMQPKDASRHVSAARSGASRVSAHRPLSASTVTRPFARSFFSSTANAMPSRASITTPAATA